MMRFLRSASTGDYERVGVEDGRFRQGESSGIHRRRFIVQTVCSGGFGPLRRNILDDLCADHHSKVIRGEISFRATDRQIRNFGAKSAIRVWTGEILWVRFVRCRELERAG